MGREDYNTFMKKLQEINQVYLDEIESILLTFYHHHANDILSLDDIQEVGVRFSLDIEKEYLLRLTMIEEEEDDDEL